MSWIRAHKGAVIAVSVILLLGLSALAGTGGCGGDEEALTDPGYAPTTTVGAGFYESDEEYGAAESQTVPDSSGGLDVAVAGTLTAAQGASEQKVITDAQLEIEVETGKFLNVFNQALLLADRYGGYVVSSQSWASEGDGDEGGGMKSGTVAIRVPVASFNKALNDAAKLGTVKNQQVLTQDVTEEYVDLEARITNSQAHVEALRKLLSQAETVDEILQVQQVLTYAQQDLEQLRGRMRYLDEHTSYSTLTMSIYETGAEVALPGEWGVGKAFKDALHNLVDAVNAIIRGLGVLVPVLIVLAIIAYIVYRIWRAVSRRGRERAQARYQAYPPQSWAGQPFQPGQPVHPGQPPQPGQAFPPVQPEQQGPAVQPGTAHKAETKPESEAKPKPKPTPKSGGPRTGGSGGKSTKS